MTTARSPGSIVRLCSIAFALSGCARAPGQPIPEPPTEDAGEAVAIDGGLAAPIVDAGACAVELAPARTSVLWLLDTSGSWERRADRYLGVADALRATASEWSSVDHALVTFPRWGDASESCIAADYEELDLAFGASSDELLAVVQSQAFQGGSTLGPALEGAIASASAQRAPGTTAAVVILTDASPFTDEMCASSEWSRVAEIAASGLEQGVRTHVLSVMSGGVAPEHFGWMATIATAGDGFTATVNGGRDDVARSAATFLADVRDHMELCSFEVPSGLVPERVVLREGDGHSTELSRVPSVAACHDTGFYLDDPRAPSTLTLCSGEGGIGGLCQLTYVRARTIGAPSVEVLCD